MQLSLTVRSVSVSGGTRWRSWLRHRATNWKVTGSIPDGVIGIFHWHNPPRPHSGPGVDSASNRNEYQEYFLGGKGSWCIGLTTLPPSCADCLEIWEPQPPGVLRTCPGLWLDCFNSTFTSVSVKMICVLSLTFLILYGSSSNRSYLYVISLSKSVIVVGWPCVLL